MRIAPIDSPINQSRVMVQLGSGKEIELWLEANVELDQKLDCWVFLMLPICMMLGEDLEVKGTVSEPAVTAFNKAQEELLIAHLHLNKINLKVEEPLESSKNITRGSQVGVFFSGGLDSTYTADTITEVNTLIGVLGFDIPVTLERHWNLTRVMLEDMSKAMSKELVLVKTNIRELSNGLILWGRDYHGTAMAGVAIALSNKVSTVYVAASHLEETKRWGQFPSLSRAFSTDHQEIYEHGAISRTAKALALSDDPKAALLRVCYRNRRNKANCANCQKCIRTRLEFSMINAQFRPIGLETKPKMSELAKIKILKNDFKFFKASIYWAKDAGYPNTLAPLIGISLARFNSIFYYKRYPEKKTKL